MTFLIELWVKFVNWISPILQPIVSVIALVLGIIAGAQTIRINGFGFHLWPFGNIQLVDGYKKGYDILYNSIHDPKIGWSARLDQCHGNVSTLKSAINDQNAAIKKAHDDGVEQGKKAQMAVDLTKGYMDVGKRKAAAALAVQPLKDETSCQRATRIILEDLK